MNINKDLMGIFFSGLCLVHCLIAPILLILGLYSANLVFLENEWIHYLLIAPMLIFAVWSMPCGLRIHHKSIPSFFAVIGIVVFIIGLISAERFEEILTICASLMLIFAHLYNQYLLNKCRPRNLNETTKKIFFK